MNHGQVYYIHLHDVNDARGGITIAYKAKRTPEVNFSEVQYSTFMFPHTKQFCRRIGRMASYGRLLKGKQHEFSISRSYVETPKFQRDIEAAIISDAAMYYIAPRTKATK